MKIKVLGAYSAQIPGCGLSSMLIDDVLLLDAGNCTAALSIEDQARIDYVLVTHAHLDHTACIPFLADNVFGKREKPIVIASIPEVINVLENHLLNNKIWPDFTKIPTVVNPVLTYRTLAEGVEQELGPYRVTPVRVHHTVPTVGYILSDPKGGIVYSGDTGPTQKLWERMNRERDIMAVFVETSFPNFMQKVADASGHLTPHTLYGEIEKIHNDSPIYLFHIKSQYLTDIERDINGLGNKRVNFAQQGKVYRFE
jgi:ribonuclease BN (tRNA processing enzyme)